MDPYPYAQPPAGMPMPTPAAPRPPELTLLATALLIVTGEIVFSSIPSKILVCFTLTMSVPQCIGGDFTAPKMW